MKRGEIKYVSINYDKQVWNLARVERDGSVTWVLRGGSRQKTFSQPIGDLGYRFDTKLGKCMRGKRPGYNPNLLGECGDLRTSMSQQVPLRELIGTATADELLDMDKELNKGERSFPIITNNNVVAMRNNIRTQRADTKVVDLRNNVSVIPSHVTDWSRRQ